MDILLVEDDENKRAVISSFLLEYFPDTNLTAKFSLQSGVRSAIESTPDLVLLDMTLPNFDIGADETGGQHHIFGGREFIRQIERFEIDTKVIVVTQFETFGKPPNIINIEQLDVMLKSDSPECHLGVVYYHASIEKWKKTLIDLIKDMSIL
jgi:DNA-binding NarL/FixJ family response regulator